MTTDITSRIAAVHAAVNSEVSNGAQMMGQPVNTDGAWIVWDQFGSRGQMDRAVKACKAARIPAFFNVAERKFGVRAS